MPSHPKPTLLLIGSDPALGYLLERFAECSGYNVLVTQAPPPVCCIHALSLAGVVFLSTEQLEKYRALVDEFTYRDTPVLVCSSIVDEVRARELGVDGCLLHPLTYESFCRSLAPAASRFQPRSHP